MISTLILLPLLAGLTPDQVFERYHANYDYLLLSTTLYEQYLPFSTHRDLDEQITTMIDKWMKPVWTDNLRYTLYGWKQGT